MAEVTGGGAPDSNSVNQSIADYIEVMSMDTEGTLKSIYLTLKDIARNDGLIISQSSLKDLADQEARAARDPRKVTRASARGQNVQGQRQQGQQGRGYSIGDDFSWDKNRSKARAKGMFDRLTDDFEDAFKDAIFGTKSPLKDVLTKSISGFAKSLGTDVNGLGKEMGKRVGDIVKNMKWGSGTVGSQLNKATESFNKKVYDVINRNLSSASRALGGTGNIDIGANVFNVEKEAAAQAGMEEAVSSGMSETAETFHSDLNDLTQVNQSGFQNVVDAVLRSQASGSDLSTEGVSDSLGEIADEVPGVDDIGNIAQMGQEAGKAVEAIEGVGTELMPVGTEIAEVGTTALEAAPMLEGMGAAATGAAAAFPPLMIALLAAPLVIDAFTAAFGPAIEGFKSFAGALSKAGNRVQSQNSKNLELWKERVKQDVNSMAEIAFDVIKDATNKAMETWDSTLNTVTTSQGYTKEAVQDLWGAYAKRLQDTGLNQFISSADIMSNLESVLKQGLSGEVAEEFAYMATYLNTLMPNQDFFQYASTYSSIAANAIKNGKDQEAALKIANDELTSFANNLLYAGRQIAGGFSSDLQNGAKLFEDAAKIAITSRTGDVSAISGVLTSVSAIVSATAPDLADSLVQAVVDAATGGNSSNLTALRSMAGTGASNTAFLNALIQDPRKVFSDLFYNLAGLQNMSADNYMEVAEGLSEVFGLSMDAFARVDFQYIADAVKNMSLNSGALQENLDLVLEGQTTSTAEQLRMAKINEYMIDEGLAYVLDSEMGRAVQQHMWDEQLAREIEENTFAVELTGGALELLQGIWQTVENIINFLNPFAWFKGIGNIALTALEEAAMEKDIEEVVKSGVVGAGTNAAVMKLLLPGGNDVSNNLLDADYYRWLTGSTSSVKSIRENLSGWSDLTGQSSAFKYYGQFASSVADMVSKSLASSRQSTDRKSTYTYSSITKSSGLEKSTAGDWRLNSSYNSAFSDETNEARNARLVQESLAKEAKQKGFQDAANATALAMRSEMETYLSKGNAFEDLSSRLQTKHVANVVNGVNLATYSVSKGVENLDKALTNLSNQANLKNAIKLDSMFSTDAEGKRVVDTVHKGYLTQREFETAVSKISEYAEASSAELSFENWVKQYYDMTVEEFGRVLADYGQDITTVEGLFNQLQSQEASKKTKAREMHEVQFWEDMQRFATQLFPEYLNEWKKYYILHEAYTKSIASEYQQIVSEEQSKKTAEGDAILRLANTLAGDDIWSGMADKIADPTLQTNMLLSKILLIVQAIMQQNNESAIVSIPTSLASLGLGVVTPAATAKQDTKNKKNK